MLPFCIVRYFFSEVHPSLALRVSIPIPARRQEISEVLVELEKLKAQASAAPDEVKNLEKQIDELVFELYELNVKDITFKVPGVFEGTVTPDYAKVVTICTSAAQRELVGLAIMAILTPLAIGSLLRQAALGAFLAGIIVTGQLLAVFMVSSGAAWDNAKKKIEDGYYGGKSQGISDLRHRRRSTEGYFGTCPQPNDQSDQSDLAYLRAVDHKTRRPTPDLCGSRKRANDSNSCRGLVR